jgi:hypothetical protein
MRGLPTGSASFNSSLSIGFRNLKASVGGLRGSRAYGGTVGALVLQADM